jgi:hypothetical protein
LSSYRQWRFFTLIQHALADEWKVGPAVLVESYELAIEDGSHRQVCEERRGFADVPAAAGTDTEPPLG